MNSKELADKIANLIFNKKGYEVKILNLKQLAAFTDYFVICSADSDTQVKAIADEIDKQLRDEGVKYWHKEGYQVLSWVLIDYVDVIVHIFKKDVREFYKLEKLWGDAPVEEVHDNAVVETKPKRTKSVQK